MLQQAEVRNLFANSINHIIEEKKLNAVAFFLPTDGEDRIECINPMMVAEPDMAKINKMVEDISTQFGLNEKLGDISDEEIEGDKIF
jgi:hypothetical protein